MRTKLFFLTIVLTSLFFSLSYASDLTELKKAYSKNGLKLSSDEGAVDGEWYKKLILEDKVPKYIQIVNVTTPEEFKTGHFKNSINIHAGNLSAQELWDALPKNKTVVFNCTAGGRSLNAWLKLKDAGFDVSEIYYFDAHVDCKGTDCKIDVNKPLE